MKLGALIMSPDASQLAEMAREMEGEGFDGIWSAHAMGRGFMMIDPFVSLSVAAGVTERVELGTAILQLPIYNPTDVALKALSLHQVSGGRFVLGVGAGSTESDYAIHGEDFSSRFQAFETKLGELRATFADGSAQSGNIGASGGPPIFFGTWGKNVARAANEFDGWIASGMHRTPEQCAAANIEYRAAGGGRAIVTTIRIMPDTDLGEMRETLAGYAEAGFDDAIVMNLSGKPLAEIRSLVPVA